MRPELREYNFDWMLNSLVGVAGSVMTATPKEIERVMPYIPNFRGVAEPLIAQGEAGLGFMNVMKKYLENIMTAHSRGKKIAISTFCFSPALFYAMDVVPITLELLSVMATSMFKRGTADYLDYCCEVGFTETSCSSQRGSLGAYLAGLGEEIDFVVCDSAGVCDTNANAFSFAAAYLDKPSYNLNYPPTLNDPRTKNYHREDYRALISFIEKQTGKRLDPERLRAVLVEVKKQDDLISELEEFQRLVPNPLPVVYNFFLYAGRFLLAGEPEYTAQLRAMVDVVRENASAGRSGLSQPEEKVRALFCYIDHYALNFKLWDWLDKNGITHLGNILSRYYPKGIAYSKERPQEEYALETGTVDTMIDSLAELNAKMPMVRTIRGPYDAPSMWLEDVLALAKVYSADCIIYNGTPGCRNTWGMVKMFARDTERHGHPTHVMYADAFDERVESWEATRERLEEFLKVRKLL